MYNPNRRSGRYWYLPVIVLVVIALPCLLPVAWFSFDYFIRMPMAVSHLERLGGYVYHDTRGLTTYDAVDLSHSSVTDNDLRYVRIIGATSVDLTGTKVSDEGLRHLHGVLYDLTITDTNITNKGIAELKQHCPECAVFRDGKRIDKP